MSKNIQVFDLSNTDGISLTSTGFKRDGKSTKSVCKIIDASIVSTRDNAKYEKEKKKLFNTLTIILPEDQSEELKRILDETGKTKLPYKEYEGKIQFKVKLNPSTKMVNNDKKPIKIDLRNVPCTDLRDYKNVTIDIVVTEGSKEFVKEDENGIAPSSRTQLSRLPKSRSRI